MFIIIDYQLTAVFFPDFNPERVIAILTRPQQQMPVFSHNAIAANTHGKPLCTLSGVLRS
jgi:hypothetical protein